MEEQIGLKSEELRAALEDALAGEHRRLAELLARHGGMPGPRPNLALATAFGEAVRGLGKGARKVLDTLAREACDAENARIFLPTAAAHGYAARIGTDGVHAWNGLFELCADDRVPVRLGLASALVAWTTRRGLTPLLVEAEHWITHEDRDHRFAACAIVLDVAGTPGTLAQLEEPARLLTWVEAVVREITDAPRAAERSPARRRLLSALPSAIAEVSATMRGGIDGMAWLAERLAEARHPDVRVAMEQAIDRLRRGGRAQSAVVVEALRAALASSAKPPRDPARIREGMSGRGKKGRNRSH